jgi:hypothetical protein
MGHRKQRKQQRKSSDQRWSDETVWAAPARRAPDRVEVDLAARMDFERRGEVAVVAKACGGCKEFIEDGQGGRGTCLHPASGILSPWTDTPGCAYHARRR